MPRYNNPAIKQLKDQQVRYAPRDVRLAQIERAEELLHQLDPERSYPYHEICESVTSYRPEMYPDLRVSGEDAVHDLRCFVEDLSDSVGVPAEAAGEAVFTVEDVSKQFNVSTKTVDRWRDRGLVSRRFVFGKRKRIGFLKSSVDRFAELHSDEIDRGSNFRQLSESEREEIIRRARRLARHGGCPAEVARRIARRMGRSPETIRYTLKNYDRDQPETAVFPNSGEPLGDGRKKEIFRRFRRGASVEDLAQSYCRTKASIYRIISEVRAQRLLDQPIDYIDNDEFRAADANEMILGEAPKSAEKTGRVKAPSGLPPYLASLYAIPLLTKEQEAYYFRKMNYLKFRAKQLREDLEANGARSKTMDRMEEMLDKATEIKNFLIRSNLRLVVSIAKRHMKPGANFFEMVSDGNMSLIRAIEKFDYGRGFKFSTYASWAIMKNFARSIPAEYSQLDRFRTGNDELFYNSTDDRPDQFREELVNRRQRQLIMSILDQLDDRERAIILHRYGLEEGAEPQTLEQVGTRFGVTKERIRQLEARALKKLRKIAQNNHLDIPGI